MKYLFLIAIIFISTSGYTQDITYIKEKGYEGYIFPKEHAIWGFPPEKHRYSPTSDDIKKAEKILKEKICSAYIKQNQKSYKKPPINGKTLKKYTRQYVGYLTSEGQVLIQIYLNKGIDLSKEALSEDIISVQGGGANHCVINVNLSTKELSNMHVNGIS
jgi:hypothetical protein